ncbi:MAG TPA: hypothetical protein VKZ63_11975 [Kofleriaceae bacterium]|nr:hypothetical protein [Kofleriaceae bacterium]
MTAPRGGLLAAAALASWAAAACGDDLAPPGTDGGAADPAPDSCQPAEPGLIAPRWIAGRAGPRDEVGAFGRPDAVLIDERGVLLAGDEDPTREELLLFDTTAAAGGVLPPLADLGADPGPAGTGPLEFAGISGLAEDREANLLYVVEQGNRRIQRLVPQSPFQPPYYASAGFLGGPAADPDAPADGTFVRPQAARVDRLGRLYVSDDARGRAPGARRDLQVFSRDGQFLFKLGDPSYGGEPGVGGRLGEPENFAIDQARDRIYVCDELTREIAVYRYSDGEFLQRVGGFTGIPNGVDLDQHGVLYVMDEGDGAEAWVRVLDPASFEELWRFGAHSGEGDLTPGAFHSADTLVIDVDRDLIVVADQGHRRVQGFSLSQVQARACVTRARLDGPLAVLEGGAIPLRVVRSGPDGSWAGSPLVERARLTARRVADGSPVALEPDWIELRAGAGAAAIRAPDAPAGEIEITAHLGRLTARTGVAVVEAVAPHVVSGRLPSSDLDWRGFVYVVGEAVVPAGTTLRIERGTTVLLEPGARLVIDGGLAADGTLEYPIHLAAADPDRPWAQIHLRGDRPSLMRHVFITGGGDTPMQHHCCGPMLWVEGAELALDEVVVTGSDGKGLLAEAGAHLMMKHLVFANLGMGAELIDSTATVSESHFINFRGPDDNDALYLRGETPYSVIDTVLSGADDDLLDTLASSPQVLRCLLHDAADKAISLDAGDPVIEESLIAGAALGVAIKNIRTAASTATIRRSTITGGRDACVEVFDADGAVVRPLLDRVVVWDCGASLRTEYDPGDFTVTSSVIEALPAGVDGAGNSAEDPIFLAPGRDFRTHPLSPARDRPAGPAGWPAE